MEYGKEHQVLLDMLLPHKTLVFEKVQQKLCRLFSHLSTLNQSITFPLKRWALVVRISLVWMCWGIIMIRKLRLLQNVCLVKILYRINILFYMWTLFQIVFYDRLVTEDWISNRVLRFKLPVIAIWTLVFCDENQLKTISRVIFLYQYGSSIEY